MSDQETTTTAPPGAPKPASILSAEDYQSYGEIVWKQFKKYRLSYYSLWGVFVLFMIAIYAPVFILNVPFYFSMPAGVGPEIAQGTSLPWFGALFDANFFESGVDIFFNFLIFAAPVAFLIWKGISGPKRRTMTKAGFQRFRTSYVLLASLLILVLFMAVYFGEFRQPYVDYVKLAKEESVSAIFPMIEYSYRDFDINMVQAKPSFAHLLGTDDRGRDVFTRMVYGTRISLTIGILAVAIYTTIGMFLGSVAGYFGGKADLWILRLIEVMICFPTFFLILTLRGFVENASVFHIMLIIGLTGWTGIARLVRAEFLRLKGLDFVQAAIALGYTKGRIIFRHVMPNALGPVLVSATFGVAGAIILEASLSFLGLGPTTAPSWGQIMNVGRMTNLWALILAPGVAIFVTVSLLNLMGEGIRDALDPKLRR